MIKPIQQNLSFGSNNIPNVYSCVTQAQKVPEPKLEETKKETSDTEPKKKVGFKESLHNAKLGFMNFIKGFNNIKDVASGAIRGVAEGIVAAGTIGVLGKNLKEHNGQILPALGGIVKDVAGEAWKIIKNIPTVLTQKTPMDTIVNGLKEPIRLAKKLKGNTATIIAASAAAIGCIAFRTIQGKINANKKNAELDHALNEGHAETK